MLWWYRFAKFDRILLGASLVTLLISSALLIDDSWLFYLFGSSTEHLEPIGSTKTAVNDVRRRYKIAFSWAPLGEDDTVYQGDSIFTGNGSEAIIVTERGEQINISPNSLVVINTRQDSIRLDINYGSVLGQIGKNKKLLISSGGDVTEFSGDDAVVKVDVASGKNLVVNVLEGQVEVASETGSRIIGPNQEAQISEAGAVVEPEDVRIDLVTPVPERIIKPDERGDLVLSWNSTYPFKQFTIEMAFDPEFKDIVFSDVSTRPLYKPPELPVNRKIYWRVTGKLESSSRPAMSELSTLTIAEDLPSLLVFPQDQMRLAFEAQAGEDGQNLHVTLHWRSRAASRNWEVQLGRRPDFHSNFKTFTSSENFVDSGPLTEGEYYYRVRAKDWQNSAWSETYGFRVVKLAPTSLIAPQATVEGNKFELVTKVGTFTAAELRSVPEAEIGNYLEVIPQLSWKAIPGATAYEVEISDNSYFDPSLIQSRVVDPSFTWNSVRPGNFYWRIRSLNSAGQFGPHSKVFPLQVRLAAPRSLTKEVQTEEVQDLRDMETAPAPFILNWTPTLFAYSYELEFDSTAEFTKPLKIQTQNSFKRVQVPAAGTFYWRVRSLDKDRAPLTEFSAPITYTYAKVYLNPESSKDLKALYPANNDSLVLIGKGELEINFRWIRPIEKGKYRLQFSESPEFEKTKLNILTHRDFHLYKGRLQDGWYYWRIRVETPTFVSPWTAPFKFQVRHENSPFNFKDSEQKMAEELERRKKELEQAKSRKAKPVVAEKPALKPPLDSPTSLSGPAAFAVEARPRSIADLKNWSKISKASPHLLIAIKPLLEWSAVERARRYKIQFARDPEFKSIADFRLVDAPSYNWSPVGVGKFYWRVFAENEEHFPGAPSEYQTIEISLAPIKSKTPHATLARAPAGKPVVALEWAPALFTSFYEVQWSESAELINAQSMVTTQFQAEIQPESEKPIYWRVRCLDDKKNPVNAFTDPRPLTFAVHKRQPASANKGVEPLFPPANGVVRVPAAVDSEINFYWSSPVKAGSYILEISSDEDFQTTVHRSRTQRSAIQAKLPLSPGTYFWRVSQIAGGKLVHQSEARPLVIETLAKPAGQ